LRRLFPELPARPVPDLVGLEKSLKAWGFDLTVLTGAGASIDMTKPEGRLFFAMFAALAGFEREFIRERTTAGMKAAKRRGESVPPRWYRRRQ
jgi:DNA invertase Pin-like site-specific DNA recombinase